MSLRFGDFRHMWVIALFDLPTQTKKQRRKATQFRNHLLDRGFSMMQYSVYQKFVTTQDAAQKEAAYIERGLPHTGKVRVLFFTSKQWRMSKVYDGKLAESAEKTPDQLVLF